jgi:hypothetical protein
MTFYRYYSICLKSPRPLWHVAPAVESTMGEPDIELFFAQADEPPPPWEKLPWSVVREQAGPGWRLSLATAPETEAGALRLSTQRQHDETTVYFGRNASAISVRWRFDGEDCERFWMELSGWLLGSVLGYAMALRGLPTLHGSVVAVNGQAIGLLGVSGAGKSTLAAAFVAAGHAMLADDHLVVGQDAGGCSALPGPPRLRLWPASLPVIEAEPATLPFSADADGKHFVEPASNAYCAQALPLAAIYILMPRDAGRTQAACETLSPAAALNALMNQRFSTAPLFPSYTATSFAKLSDLAQRIPVRLLYRPQGLETLPAVVRTIQEDALANAH